jgi:hypothetical protein
MINQSPHNLPPSDKPPMPIFNRRVQFKLSGLHTSCLIVPRAPIRRLGVALCIQAAALSTDQKRASTLSSVGYAPQPDL